MLRVDRSAIIPKKDEVLIQRDNDAYGSEFSPV
jgi:hypothetical protein